MTPPLTVPENGPYRSRTRLVTDVQAHRTDVLFRRLAQLLRRP